VPCAADAVGRALCVRVCLVVVVVAVRRRAVPFVGGGNLVRGAIGSVGDFVDAVEADDSGLDAVFFVSTRVDSGLADRPVFVV
jgi:hypothetical protein